MRVDEGPESLPGLSATHSTTAWGLLGSPLQWCRLLHPRLSKLRLMHGEWLGVGGQACGPRKTFLKQSH